MHTSGNDCYTSNSHRVPDQVYRYRSRPPDLCSALCRLYHARERNGSASTGYTGEEHVFTIRSIPSGFGFLFFIGTRYFLSSIVWCVELHDIYLPQHPAAYREKWIQ